MTETKTPGPGNQWVVFTVGHERYGVAATQVQEVVRYPEPTLVPDMPPFVKGVMNLRGKIIPVVDLQERFGIAGAVDRSQQRVVVAVFGALLVGIVVHAVSGVVRIPADQIEILPAMLPKVESEFIAGVGKVGSDLVVLLNLERLLASMEKMMLPQRVQGAAEGH